MINDIMFSINRSTCVGSGKIKLQRVIRYDKMKDRMDKINKLLNK